MGQTLRRTRVYEVVIACEDCAPLTSGHERKQAGDIIGLRPVTAPQAGAVGSGERHRYLWLTLELTDELAEAITSSNGAFEKRRYQVPFSRLAAVVPGFSASRAKDTNDLYQPFGELDADAPYTRLTPKRPLSPDGLVFDTATGRYL